MYVDIYEKKYGKRVSLRDIHLHFPEGETTLIIGTSGAGKSTLIKCITQQTTYDGKVEGCDRRDIAYIPQHPALNMRETAYESVYWSARFSYLFEKRSRIRSLADEYIRKVGLESVQDHTIDRLSGGQMQRVSIARELIRRKNVIIADEIDTGLDCGVAKSLIEMLSDVTHRERMTTIVISHNLVNVDLYDNTIVLVKDSDGTGRIAYAGKTRGLRSFFGVSEYVDILTRVNRKEEGGGGEADFYIGKFRATGRTGAEV